ncbi:leucyl aminopeptidase [Ottowia caeni]|uniref:leucyl aminopeptidase n=1 Tax=Ottowia caeni TaxID=2870339 RepID=UPI001E298FDD|nr:leucyl aminopeptidase [Ottowia caeni]
MNFELKTLRLNEAAAGKSGALVVLVADDFKAGEDAISALVRRAIDGGDFKTEAGRMLQAYGAVRVMPPRLILAGIGDGSAASVRKAVAAAVAALKGGSAKDIALCFSGPATGPAVAAAVHAAADASYVYTATKSKPEPSKLARVLVGVPDADADADELREAFATAVAAVRGIQVAREWANRPANHATPMHLAEAARELAKGARFACEILGPKEVSKLGMGAFMAVARGSEQELRFIVLRYTGTAKSTAPVVLVGKGITFDTGGISIKPAAEMDEMKYDMSGAASVLGVFRSLAELKPAVNVVGLIPACENMPDGRAIKPGDVVTSMSGQTIEILNTDAEGRLVLCDALTYAKRFEPSALIDIATLTGACVIALGGVRSGLFANNDDLSQALVRAGNKAQDLCWPMPLDEEYAEGLKTNFADVANVAGRAAGSVTAAKFLQRFVEKTPWAHLDIAGTAWKGGAAKGATGRPVALLLQYLVDQGKQVLPATPLKASRKSGAGAKASAKVQQASRRGKPH